MARQLVRASTMRLDYSGGSGVSGFPITLATWVYPDTLPAVAWPFIAGSGGVYVSIVTVGTVVRAQISDGSATLAASPSSTMVTGQWQHLCAVYKFSGAGSIAIYHNGALVGSTANDRGFPTQAHVRAGADLVPSNYWDGRLADMAIWSTDLTEGEVMGLARGGSPNHTRLESLKLYWPLWGLSSPEPDISGGGRHGTLTNSPTAAEHAPTGPLVRFAG